MRARHSSNKRLAARKRGASCSFALVRSPNALNTASITRFTLAYAENLSSHLPLIFSVIVVNTFVLSTAFFDRAPTILTIWLPVFLVCVVCIRADYWLLTRVKARPLSQLKRDLRRMPASGGLIAGSFTGWVLLLYRHADQSLQSLVHYVVAVTCFSGILSLGQSPRTAKAMAFAVVVPTSIVFLLDSHPNRVSIVMVQVIVTGILLQITSAYHNDFLRLESSRQELARRREAMEALAETHRINATQDSLTGTFNRGKILGLLKQALEESGKSGPWLALVDLDGFKHINDTFGHAAGDGVLKAVCNRISEVEEVFAFGRMGGDEFALILQSKHSAQTAITVLEHLSQSICKPIRLGELRLSVKASLGLYRCKGTNVSDCLERADAALYRAKDSHDGSIVRFSSHHEKELRERRAITRVFAASDLRMQISLVYQPIIDADTGQVLAFEALARWSPDGVRWLPPATFINLAETTGRISELTELVLERALHECSAFDPDTLLTINLSARDILRDDAAKWIGDKVVNSGVEPSRLVLEITETAMLRDYRRAAKNLAALREAGFRIALDDFGTGQSSLSHVHHLPLDHIKIDRSFAQNLVTSKQSRTVVSTIIALARQLGLGCTIEGIETAEQQAVARSLGLRIMQGYLFGRPASIDNLRKRYAA